MYGMAFFASLKAQIADFQPLMIFEALKVFRALNVIFVDTINLTVIL